MYKRNIISKTIWRVALDLESFSVVANLKWTELPGPKVYLLDG